MLEKQPKSLPPKKSTNRNVWRSDGKGRLPPVIHCKIKSLCGVCDYINENYHRSLDKKFRHGVKILEGRLDLTGVKLIQPKEAPKSLGYRAHAKLAVAPSRNGKNRFAIGMYQPKSHRIIDVSQCPVHKESINAIIREIRAELENMPIQPYDETNHTGDLRFIAIRASHLTNELMLTFVLREDKFRQEIQGLVSLMRHKGHIINSAHININPEKTNVIFGSLSKRIAGTDRLRERLCGLDFEIGPTSFFQVNPWQAELVYRRISHLAGSNLSQSIAWDLYCGTGQISILLASAGYRTLGIEENPQACRDGQKNVRRNHLEQQPTFITCQVEDLPKHLPAWAMSPQLIVANPSRHGLSSAALDLIRDTLLKNRCRFLYLSCEMESFARDVQYLTTNTGVKLHQLESFDMFPYTAKMEWLGVFS